MNKNKFKELFEKQQEIEKEKLQIGTQLTRFETKKKELESRLDNGQEKERRGKGKTTSEPLSKYGNLTTMG